MVGTSNQSVPEMAIDERCDFSPIESWFVYENPHRVWRVSIATLPEGGNHKTSQNLDGFGPRPTKYV